MNANYHEFQCPICHKYGEILGATNQCPFCRQTIPEPTPILYGEWKKQSELAKIPLSRPKEN